MSMTALLRQICTAGGSVTGTYTIKIPQIFIWASRRSTLGLNGFHEFDDHLGLSYNTRGTKDEIDSTSYRFGDFFDREYLKISLVPQYRSDLSSNELITFKFGASHDYSNRNGSKFSSIGEIGFLRSHNTGDSEFFIFHMPKVPNLPVIQQLPVIPLVFFWRKS